MVESITKEQVAQQIETAFEDAKYPGDDNLVVRLDYADYLQIVIDFKGKHWKQITTEVVLEHRFDLSRFIPEAFRFYLPAYLIAALGDDKGVEVIDHIISNLDPREDEGNARDKFLTRVGGWTLKQKAAIKAFMRWYKGTEAEERLIPPYKRAIKFWEDYPVENG